VLHQLLDEGPGICGAGAWGFGEKDEERFLSAQADTFAGSERGKKKRRPASLEMTGGWWRWRKLNLDAEHLDAEHGVDSGAGGFGGGFAAFQRGKRSLLGVWRRSGGLVRGRLLGGRLCGGGR